MENKKKIKKKKPLTPEYTSRAISKYRESRESTGIVMPMGTKQKVKDKYGDISFNKYVNTLIEKDLNSPEKIEIE